MRERTEGKREEFQGPSPCALQHQQQTEEEEPVAEAEKEQAVRQEETDRTSCSGCQLHKALPGGKNVE